MSAVPGKYRHSEVFSVLKARVETLQTNLTTNQYIRTLDSYLTKAVLPIVECTDYFDGYLGKMLAWQEENFRRKLSMRRDLDLPSVIMEFTLRTSAAGKMEVWQELALDRAVVMQAVRNFLDCLVPYQKAHNCELPLPDNVIGDPLSYWLYYTQQVEKTFNARRPLIPVIQQAEYWLYQATEFKQVIIEKYIRLCLTQAQRDYVSFFNCQVDLDDIIQSYIIAASRAIDKCDAQQGALTSHIQKWFLTARNLFNKRRLQEAKESSFESLDDLNIALESQNDPVLCDMLSVNSVHLQREEVEQVRVIAQMADPKGYGRLLLGIEETFPDNVIQLLRTFVVPR
jgi:hypothetical protein